MGTTNPISKKQFKQPSMSKFRTENRIEENSFEDSDNNEESEH